MKKSILLLCLFSFFSLLSNAQAPDFAWAKSASGSDDDEGCSICVDASGNTYITGYFYSPTITFGATVLTNKDTSTNTTDIFIAKYDASGNLLWAKSAGGSDYDFGYGISVDATGNSYITGDFESTTISFGTTTLSNNGSGDIFIAKYDASGNVVWAKSAGGSHMEDGYSISTDAVGDSYITGYFYSTIITFGTTTLSNNGGDDIFIVKYDASGNVVWAKSAGGSDDDDGLGICIDASGNSYITGRFDSPTITFGTTTLTNNNASVADFFIAKYDAWGNVVWAKSAGGSFFDEGNDIKVDAYGNSYITGDFTSPTIIFGTTTLTNNGYDDIYIVKYDATGNVVWAKSAGGGYEEGGLSLGLDASGNSYIAGFFGSSAIQFGTTTLTNNGGYDIYIVKYNASGNVVWAKSAGGSGDEGGTICVDASGNSYITDGFASPAITFGVTTLTNVSPGLEDVFIAKLNNVAGIPELTNNSNDVSVFPNPATNNLTIETPQPATIEISNIQGQLLKTLATDGNKTNVDVASFPAGVYIIKVKTDKEITTKKFIKQ